MHFDSEKLLAVLGLVKSCGEWWSVKDGRAIQRLGFTDAVEFVAGRMLDDSVREKVAQNYRESATVVPCETIYRFVRCANAATMKVRLGNTNFGSSQCMNVCPGCLALWQQESRPCETVTVVGPI